jgi:hypothetical protein
MPAVVRAGFRVEVARRAVHEVNPAMVVREAMGSLGAAARPQLRRDFHIHGSERPRPAARAVIYCDGGTDDQFREGVDLELSHWIPNRTPPGFKADTSTEICLGFVASGDPRFDLVVNNHVDVDGVLAVFTLVAGEWALAHGPTLTQAAEMGDFWAWGEPRAQALFQTLTALMRRLQAEKADAGALYSRCFDHVFAFLSEASAFVADPGLAALADSVALIERGEVARTVLGEHFAHYAIPRHLAAADLARALRVPGFNAPLSRECLLWPQARARFDRQRAQLVSVEAEAGWYYDLWFPGHVWAETPRSWRPAGLSAQGDSNTHVLDHPPLLGAVDALARLERASGQWALARRVTPFSSLEGRGFPVVLSFLADQQPAASSLEPGLVAARLAEAFR